MQGSYPTSADVVVYRYADYGAVQTQPSDDANVNENFDVQKDKGAYKVNGAKEPRDNQKHGTSAEKLKDNVTSGKSKDDFKPKADNGVEKPKDSVTAEKPKDDNNAEKSKHGTPKEKPKDSVIKK